MEKREKGNASHLDLTAAERSRLRAHKIRVKEIHQYSLKHIQDILRTSPAGTSVELQEPRLRAMELRALSEFQSVPSIGIRFACDLISLGYYSLKELRGKDPTFLLNKYERQIGAWTDPCVEDQFRLVVHYANNPGSKKNWWDFTAERKAYREKNGYPPSRPQRPWFGLPQYKTANRIGATNELTRNDLHKRLKPAIAFMKKEFSSPITIRKLADVASLSQYHFIRNFKSAYEITPAQFLTRIRLKKASLLLKRSELDIDEILLACGFGDKSSFIRLFKREMKRTPMEYRREHQRSRTLDLQLDEKGS
jgi:AraC-like DNA-binding protein